MQRRYFARLISLTLAVPVFKDKSPSHTATYNHAISGLMLGEVYGHIAGPRAKKARAAIVKALNYSRALQTRDKPFDTDCGGVRYLPIKPGESDADLSVTAWTLMFYRLAKNAEFNVPQQYADQAVTYVRRCWDRRGASFSLRLETGGLVWDGPRHDWRRRLVALAGGTAQLGPGPRGGRLAGGASLHQPQRESWTL